MKIALVSGQYSPFQLEVAEAVNSLGVDYHVVFDQFMNRRSDHWINIREELKENCTQKPVDASGSWLDDVLQELSPDVVLIGGIRGPRPRAAKKYKKRSERAVKIGYWLEPPNPQPNPILKFARVMEYALRLRQVDFVFAIGPNTKDYYSRHNADTFLLPYGQDLSKCLNRQFDAHAEPLTVLFSGGLEKRHNFDLITAALRQVINDRGPCIRFIVSGYGPEEVTLRAILDQDPELSSITTFERDFAHWEDRLEPFLKSHILVYPTDYAGWGLVVPEAMASGMAVLSTRFAEAAEYYIEDGVSGVIVDRSDPSIAAGIIRCVDDREFLTNISSAARESASRGHAESVASKMLEYLDSITTK